MWDKLLLKIKRFFIRIKKIKRQSSKNYVSIFFNFLFLKKELNISFYEYYKFELEKDTTLRQNFLSAINKKKYLEILNPRKYYILARNKFFSHVYLDMIQANKAELYCYYDPSFKSVDKVCNTYDAVLNILHTRLVDKCVIKTTESSHGDGVIVVNNIEYSASDCILTLFNGERKSLRSVLSKEPLIFESVITQIPQFAKFNQSSVNTIRIMTALKPDGTSDVFSAFLKVGRSGSCVDNAGSGGNVMAKVDIESGLISNVMEFSGWRNTKQITKHPDSNILLDGVIIENWSHICSVLKGYQSSMPFLKAIGWDVAITPEGPLIIEFNDYWDETGQLFTQEGWLKQITKYSKLWK